MLKVGMFYVLVASFVLYTSCNKNEILESQVEATIETVEKTAVKEKKQHAYGGWFCPDNFGGFPPVDIQELDKVPVVSGRLPTKEETSNGTALMYIDPIEYPYARPLKMKLPRVARIHSSHNDMDELIIVIQAVVIGTDTVVGFRYPSGGNGSSWFGEVRFLSDEELEEIGSTPFVYINSAISASKEKIWEAITTTTYAKKIAEKFDKKSFFKSSWTDESVAHLNYESEEERATGIVTTLWGNFYLQIDYDYNDFHFAEKILILENPADNSAQLHIVSGPYPEGFDAQNLVWEEWVQEVKTLSEMD